MTGWIAVSDVLAPADGPDLSRGRLVFDLGALPHGPTLLLDHALGDAALSLLHDPATGFGLMRRQGRRLVRHMLEAPAAAGPAQLAFDWDCTADSWVLSLSPADGGALRATGSSALPLPRALLAAAFSAPRHRNAALGWFGAARGALPPGAAMLGPRTPVDTAQGPRPVASLKPGDLVRTRDHGLLPLLSVQRQVWPGLGGNAPMRLRAPFFRAPTDLHLSPMQPIVLAGEDVEYLFGEPEVLVPARHLADGARALPEPRAALLPWITLDFGHPVLLCSGGCLLAAGAPPAPPPRMLDAVQARALQSMRRRGALRPAA